MSFVLMLVGAILFIALFPYSVFVLAIAIIFITREWSHMEMCEQMVGGDKAEKLHKEYHKDGFI